MERLRCVVERITYQNEQNGYSVMSFYDPDDNLLYFRSFEKDS